MNWDNWFVPKNELITEDKVRLLIRSVAVNTSLSRTFIRSRMVRAIRARPTPNWAYSCSPTVLTRLLLRWSISSTSAFELLSWIRYLMIDMISLVVKTLVSEDSLKPSFLLILYLSLI